MGTPAARMGDQHVCPMVDGVKPHIGGPIISPGCPTVLINGKPAANMGTTCACAGPPDAIIVGSMTVLIGGKPAARLLDATAHGGVIIMGSPNVLIGMGAGSGGSSGSSSSAKSANPQKEGAAQSSSSSKTAPPGAGVKQAKQILNTEALKAAAQSGAEEAEKTKEEDFAVKFTYVDETAKPVKGNKYEITTGDGKVYEGKTDANGDTQTLTGYTTVDCQVKFFKKD